MKRSHALAEKIRQLCRGIAIEREESSKWESVTSVQIKQELVSAKVLLMPHHQTYKPLVYYQPVRVFDGDEEKNNLATWTYRIPTIVYISVEKPLEKTISPFAANQRIKVKRKKKRSSTFSRIEELLSRGRNVLLLPDPVEESPFDEVSEESALPPKRNITDLSEDILQYIFWYFTVRERCTLSKVCKTWNYILKDPIFWTQLEFEGDEVPVPVILHLIKNSPLLQSLKLTAVSDAALILHELARGKTDMKILAVRYCSLNTIDKIQALTETLSSFPKLEVLDLKGTEFQSERFTLDLYFLKNLKSLNLGASKFLQPRDLMTISINCRQLEILEVLDIPSNTVRKGKLTDENFSFIITNLHDSLNNLKFDMQQLGNSAYLSILQCNKLTCLHLTNCLFLTGEMLRKFNRFENLRDLKITRAINVCSEDFEHLFAGGSQSDLQHLDISGCWRFDEAGLKAVTKALPSLISLSLDNCKSIKGNDLTQISRCTKLCSLNIARTGISSRSLLLISANAKKLKVLIIDQSMNNEKPVTELRALLPGLKIHVIDSEI